MGKTVFIWIPRNAGTSIYSILRKQGCVKIKRKSQAVVHYNNKMVTFGHMDYSSLMNEGYIKKEDFKFCFSRNPYDRAVSLFEWKKSHGIINCKNSFDWFVDMLHQGIHPIGDFNSKGFSICNPQIEWVKGLELDFCGSVENLQRDFRLLSQILDFPYREVAVKNTSPREETLKYYNRQTREKVKNFYCEDFEYFGYKK